MTVRIASVSPDSNLREAEFPEGTLRVLQLTDTHLYADPDQTLLGINTLDSFRRVLRYFQAVHWSPHLLLATGDLVHDASSEGYRRLGQALSELDVPVFCLPGNHDEPATMREHLRADKVTTRTVETHGDWTFVMLDTVIAGEEGGHLASGQLDALEQALAAADRHVLVCMHHQPVDVGSAWIDTMTLNNPDRLFDIVDRFDNIRGILWGHVHQSYDAMRNGVRLMASPSTCVQFAPFSDKFQVDEEPPGFRLLALLPDGRIMSEVVRIDEMPDGVELASAGY